jgi:hypothetical protein
MDSAAPSEQSPLVQPKKSRRFVAGALAASAVLGLLAVTSARSSGGLRAVKEIVYFNQTKSRGAAAAANSRSG